MVLIVGAGPAGLAAAIELGSRGVCCIVIGAARPRRRRAAREDDQRPARASICAAGALPTSCATPRRSACDYPANVVFATRLNGFEAVPLREQLVLPSRPEPVVRRARAVDPAVRAEKVLKAHAESLPGVEIRFGCRLESFSQSRTSVRATLGDDTVESKYLIGADGSRSTVRQLDRRNHERCDARPALQRHLPRAGHRPCAPARTGGRCTGSSTARRLRSLGRWTRVTSGSSAAISRPAASSKAEGAKAPHPAMPPALDLPVEILSNDEWVAHRLIADALPRTGEPFSPATRATCTHRSAATA